MSNAVVAELSAVARKAGAVIMTYFGSSTLGVRQKPDHSQVTDADMAASHLIAEALPKIWQAPVLCEEALVDFEVRRHWQQYWLVDPLDGTKDFLAGEKDFTVCIALITNGQPSLGVIFAPALDEMYEAESGKGAFVTSAGKRVRLTAQGGGSWAAVRSRFHDGGETTAFFDRNGVSKTVLMGSALKFGRIASGSVNIFPRLRGCHDWDVAAGQIIVIEAGGALLALPGGGPLVYNTAEAKVAPFVALAAAADFSRLRF